jgi:hypothetical protein
MSVRPRSSFQIGLGRLGTRARDVSSTGTAGFLVNGIQLERSDFCWLATFGGAQHAGILVTAWG